MGKACDRRPGKHPRTQHGYLDGSTDPEVIREWWRRWPDANIGIVTGKVSGNLVGLDIDPAHGGDVSLAELERQYGALPNTWIVRTGGGGYHHYFIVPEGIEVRCSTGVIAPGIDVKGEGGYLVAPPSLHQSGNRYELLEASIPPVLCPEWPLTLMLKASTSHVSEKTEHHQSGAKVPIGKRRQRILHLVGKMCKAGMTPEAIIAAVEIEIEQAFEDPQTADDVRRIVEDILRRDHARATGQQDEEVGHANPQSAQAAAHDTRPKVRLPGDNFLLSQTADALSECLCDEPLFARNGELVVLDNRRLRIVSPQAFRTLVERYVVGYRIRQKGENIFVVEVTMSDSEARGVLASSQFIEKLRPVARLNLCRQPILRPGGEIELLPDGYDSSSQTLTIASVLYAEDMPLADAVATLDDLFGEFVFSDEKRSKAVAVAAVMNMYCAQLLPDGALRPCFVVTKNAEGAGATTLVSCAVVPVVGALPAGAKASDEDETRKSLTAAVRDGKSVILFDNQKFRLSSASLEAFVSSPMWTDRLLGVSQTFTGPNLATVFVTANGCTVSPDMRRRSLFIELRLEAEKAEDREFRRPLDLVTLLTLRPKILAACWSLVCNWQAQGMPPPSRSHSAFPAWAKVVGGIVEAAGYGCALDSAEVAAVADEDGESMRTLLEVMELGKNYTFGEIADLCLANECFTGVIGEGMDPKTRSKLGWALARYDRRRVKDHLFVIDGKGRGRRFFVQ
jgi:hypothetical protein